MKRPPGINSRRCRSKEQKKEANQLQEYDVCLQEDENNSPFSWKGSERDTAEADDEDYIYPQHAKDDENDKEYITMEQYSH